MRANLALSRIWAGRPCHMNRRNCSCATSEMGRPAYHNVGNGRNVRISGGAWVGGGGTRGVRIPPRAAQIGTTGAKGPHMAD